MTPRHARVALAIALGFFVATFALAQQDMPPDDPLYYAEFAHDIAADPAAAFHAPSTYPWNMRIGLTVPIAGFYRVFGVSKITTNLPCLLAALAIILVAFASAPTPRARLLAMVFAVSCAPLMRHGVLLNADLPCGALLACSILALSRRDGPRGRGWLIGAIALWLWAFLVKETAIWAIPIWAYAITIDARASGLRATAARFAPALITGVVLAAAYLALCAAVWGDPLARFRGIQDLTFAHGWTMHGKSAGVWAERLLWGPLLLVAAMFRALLVPAVLGAWLVRGRDALWGIALITLTAGFWLGSSSVTAYEPLPLWPRMVTPIIAPLIIVAAIASDHALTRFRASSLRTAVVAVLALALVIPAAMHWGGQIRRPRPETDAYAELRDELAVPGATVVLVCSDRWFPTLVGFAWGFEVPPNLILVDAAAFPSYPVPAGAVVRTIVNFSHGTDIPAVAPIEAAALRPIVSSGKVRLYAVDDVVAFRAALSR